MKLFQKVLEEMQVLLRQLQEKFCEKKKKLYHVFVDLKKAVDRVPRKAIEKTKSARKTRNCSHVSVCGIKIKGENSSRISS